LTSAKTPSSTVVLVLITAALHPLGGRAGCAGTP
jgi:hypothetical protein